LVWFWYLSNSEQRNALVPQAHLSFFATHESLGGVLMSIVPSALKFSVLHIFSLRLHTTGQVSGLGTQNENLPAVHFVALAAQGQLPLLATHSIVLFAQPPLLSKLSI